jgi:hypothetical protein
MNEHQLSVPRRVSRGVFAGLGLVFLVLIPRPFVLDADMRRLFVNHDLANRKFCAMASGFGVWLLYGLPFLLAAFFIAKANFWGLLAMICLNVVGIVQFWNGTKEVALIPPLCLSLVCLVVEDCRIFPSLRRRTT